MLRDLFSAPVENAGPWTIYILHRVRWPSPGTSTDRLQKNKAKLDDYNWRYSYRRPMWTNSLIWSSIGYIPRWLCIRNSSQKCLNLEKSQSSIINIHSRFLFLLMEKKRFLPTRAEVFTFTVFTVKLFPVKSFTEHVIIVSSFQFVRINNVEFKLSGKFREIVFFELPLPSMFH
ncbi:hypothetical protein CAEBREN_08025 [Caenorhabditis brenneri]|uniref:Uncharacterized protein n=1 Tax=Caenorhabditis brenneri TaxID=135651 RepID=G0MUS4_CAEBE|nr:hypothetical protein CAEBREN_08025 [Caenorhabditis brenneri]